MLETLLILVVMGIFAALSIPSFSSLYSSIRVDQAVTKVQTTLSWTQRLAIRNNQACVASLLVQSVDSAVIPQFQSGIVNHCQVTDDLMLPKGISVVSNIKPSLSKLSFLPIHNSERSGDTADSWWNRVIDYAKNWVCNNWGWCSSENSSSDGQIVDVGYGSQSTVSFDIASSRSTPEDTTGKIVLFSSSRPQKKQKCIAISRRIGLTRQGNYQGGLSPSDITDEGICTSQSWKKQ